MCYANKCYGELDWMRHYRLNVLLSFLILSHWYTLNTQIIGVKSLVRMCHLVKHID